MDTTSAICAIGLAVCTLTTALGESVDINLNVRHEVGGVSRFDREKFIVLHADLIDNEWDSDAQRAQFLTDYDVYLGRNNGALPWHLSQTTEDPAKPGWTSHTSLANRGANARASYAAKTAAHAYVILNNLERSPRTVDLNLVDTVRTPITAVTSKHLHASNDLPILATATETKYYADAYLQPISTVSVAFPDSGGHVASASLQVFGFSADIRNPVIPIPIESHTVSGSTLILGFSNGPANGSYALQARTNLLDAACCFQFNVVDPPNSVMEPTGSCIPVNRTVSGGSSSTKAYTVLLSLLRV